MSIIHCWSLTAAASVEKKGAGKKEKKGIVAYLLELIAHFRSWLGFAASRHIPDGPDTIPHPGMRL